MNPEVNLHASPTGLNQERTPALREWIKPAAKVAEVSVATLLGHASASADGTTCAS
ncbi:hypothetical protein [Terriglobus albidus]|uniref:hypothetical protein n=1 Tax=Terriglobus albidus TaxID=1592106 RepID=UPI0021E0F7DA|nr:hypothetical protein [Terriglobus albidus]